MFAAIVINRTTVSSFFSKFFAFSRGEKRTSSEEFEAAVNAALLSDTVNESVKKPYISEEGSQGSSAQGTGINSFCNDGADREQRSILQGVDSRVPRHFPL